MNHDRLPVVVNKGGGTAASLGEALEEQLAAALAQLFGKRKKAKSNAAAHRERSRNNTQRCFDA